MYAFDIYNSFSPLSFLFWKTEAYATKLMNSAYTHDAILLLHVVIRRCLFCMKSHHIKNC